MSWKLNLLTGLAKKIYSAVHPLLGTAEAKKIVGSGFGGDETRLIDNVSERAALQYLRKSMVLKELGIHLNSI